MGPDSCFSFLVPRMLFRNGRWTDTACCTLDFSRCGCRRWCRLRSRRRSPYRLCGAWTLRWRCLSDDLSVLTVWPAKEIQKPHDSCLDKWRRFFLMTYLFIIRVTDDQKGVIWPREDVFTSVIPANSVDLQWNREFGLCQIGLSCQECVAFWTNHRKCGISVQINRTWIMATSSKSAGMKYLQAGAVGKFK